MSGCSQEAAATVLERKEAYIAAMQARIAQTTPAAGLSLQLASDLHLEFYDESKSVLDFVDPSAPVLGLLGDIGLVYHQGHRRKYTDFLHSACEHFDVVLLLAGNHEFYGGSKPNMVTVTGMDAIRDTIRGMCMEVNEQSSRGVVVFLDDDAVTIGGVRIVGSTLWSHVPADSVETVEKRMNDYKSISMNCPEGEERKLSAQDTNNLHANAVDFITNELSTHRPAIILTHHAPSFDIPGKDARSIVKHGMATDLHPLLTAHRKSLACWAFGHTHVSCNKLICGVRVVSNQHGYPQPHEGEPDTFYNRRFTISFKIKNATE